MPPPLNPCGYRISIHAPHARSDLQTSVLLILRVRFQSTLLMRGATKSTLFLLMVCIISIHAPHARSDFDALADGQRLAISIHAPHARSDARGGK